MQLPMVIVDLDPDSVMLFIIGEKDFSFFHQFSGLSTSVLVSANLCGSFNVIGNDATQINLKEPYPKTWSISLTFPSKLYLPLPC